MIQPEPSNEQRSGVRNIFNRRSTGEIRFLLGYIKPYRVRFLASMGALLVSSMAALAFPALTGMLIDAVTNPGNTWLTQLDTLALAFLGILVVQAIASFFRTYLLQDVSERSLADLRESLYGHIVSLPIDFFNRRRVGDLTSRLGSDVTTIQTTMTTTLSETIRQLIILVGGISLIIYTSPRLTGIVLLALPAVVGLAVVLGRAVRRASKEVQNRYAELNTVAEETFQAISVVKTFTAESRERLRFRERLGEIIAISLKVARIRGLFVAFVVFLIFGGLVGVIWYGGTLVQAGELTIGELTSFVLYAAFVAGAMGSFADLYGNIQRAVGAAEEIRLILEESPEDQGEPAAATAIGVGVQFRDVSFSYPTRSDLTVIDSFTATIPPGASLALVGASGAGKSTIASLLMRFYEPTSGSLLINGERSTELDLRSYRELVALVPQDVVLFGGTIRENILYGRPDATEKEMWTAAHQANADEFIHRFPEGYDTVVGERGVQLSGGQRQRIAIARAIIKNPSILILDEATSALDTESERLVQEALGRVMRGRTTLVIAHRLSTIRDVDHVAVLKCGKLVEHGTYEELISADGLFAQMVRLQMSVDDRDQVML